MAAHILIHIYTKQIETIHIVQHIMYKNKRISGDVLPLNRT